jgi:alkylated DNA repair dioxygenase AlkB
METLVDKDGALVVIFRQWLIKKDAEKLFQRLYETIPWISGEDRPIKMYGKEHAQPRKMYMMGDSTPQKYSGLSYDPQTWDPDLLFIRKEIEKQLQCDLDSCLLNLYENGKSGISYHSDREASGDNDVVVILSLGGTRDFLLKNKETKKVIKTKVGSGDLMLMAGTCQRLYKHSVPKRVRAETRISASYRYLRRITQ